MSPARSTSRKLSSRRLIDLGLFLVMSLAAGVGALFIASAALSHLSDWSHFFGLGGSSFGEWVQWIESLRSLVVSIAVMVYLAIRWLRSRQHHSFERYFDNVTAIEKQVLMHEAVDPIDLKALERLRRDVTGIKAAVLDRYASGTLRGEERMSAFLTHAIDVRNYVQELILFERERQDERELMLEARAPRAPRRRRGLSQGCEATSFEGIARKQSDTRDFRKVAEVGAPD